MASHFKYRCKKAPVSHNTILLFISTSSSSTCSDSLPLYMIYATSSTISLSLLLEWVVSEAYIMDFEMDDDTLNLLGPTAIILSYLKENELYSDFEKLANDKEFPEKFRNDQALQEILIRWAWSSGMQTVATRIATKFDLNHVIYDIHMKEGVGGSGAGQALRRSARRDHTRS